jgi:hypothetical protein
VGEEVALYIRFTVRNHKRVQGIVFLLNLTHDRLASAVEFVSTAAHLDSRRTVALPAALASRIDEMILQQAALAWPAPRSGAISV